MDKYTVKHSAIALEILADALNKCAKNLKQYGCDDSKDYDFENALKQMESAHEIISDILTDQAAKNGKSLVSRLAKVRE